MASDQAGRPEDEPLLGAPEATTQPEEKGYEQNLTQGTAILAQAGIWILTATIWVSVLKSPIIPLFTPHPLLNSAGILLIVQAILILQPTHTPKQKRDGANIHGIINGTAILSLLAALIIIEANKFKMGKPHFTSVHGKLGLIVYIIFIIQAIIGITQYYTPMLYGSVDNAKAIWKYHRMSGYVLLVLAFAVIATATSTGLNQSSLHINLWVVIVTGVITLAGIVPRIKKKKLGFKQ